MIEALFRSSDMSKQIACE